MSGPGLSGSGLASDFLSSLTSQMRSRRSARSGAINLADAAGKRGRHRCSRSCCYLGEKTSWTLTGSGLFPRRHPGTLFSAAGLRLGAEGEVHTPDSNEGTSQSPGKQPPPGLPRGSQAARALPGKRRPAGPQPLRLLPAQGPQGPSGLCLQTRASEGWLGKAHVGHRDDSRLRASGCAPWIGLVAAACPALPWLC